MVGEMHKLRENNLFLTDSQIELLKKYHINYKNYTVNQLIYEIDEILAHEEDEELENLASELAEYHYYEEVRK